MMGSRFRAVLTGASSGIGQAMVNALAERCDALLLVGRDAERLAQLRDGLRSKQPLAVEIVTGDLTEDATRQRVHDAARAMPGPVDLLINNAGINEFHEFESQRPDSIARLLEVNLIAPMQLTQKLLPLLRAAPRAQIVNVGSIFGYLGYPGLAAYSASKFGLRGFSQALRRELADTSIAVRYFAPRATATAFNTAAMTAMNRELGINQDTPELVADSLVQFLASGAPERKLGFPESLYAFLNQLLPGLNDGAIRTQLKTIRKHLPASSRLRSDATAPASVTKRPTGP